MYLYTGALYIHYMYYALHIEYLTARAGGSKKRNKLKDAR